MSDNDNPQPPDDAPPGAESGEKLAPYVIEAARSSRSRCKTCRKPIKKDVLRIGFVVEGGFYGPGYLWHHLACAAKRHLDKVEEAYALEAWKSAQRPPEKVPELDELRALKEKADAERAERKAFPFVEVDPSGRARCKQCGQPIEKGSLRVVLGKEVTFGSQTRTSPLALHPGCVAAAFDQPDVVTEREGLREQLLENSGLEAERIDAVMAQIGTIPPAPEEPEEPQPG